MNFRPSKDIMLDEFFRKEFSKPFGKILKGNEIGKSVGSSKTIYAVGDVTVSALLRLGYMPKVSVFDYRTGREARIIPIIKTTYKRPMKVVNRSGTLSVKLWNVIGKAARKRLPIGIKVTGEEDLASLACIYFARNGDFVMYGLRNRGIITIKVNKKIKKYVVNALRTLLSHTSRNSY